MVAAPTPSATLPEPLARMVAARQLTEADARAYLRQPGTPETGEEAVLRWVAREYGVFFEPPVSSAA